MAPINLPDGSQVSEIVLPDGSTASEVLAPDGSRVFPAIPDSVVSRPVDGNSSNDSAAVGIQVSTTQAWTDIQVKISEKTEPSSDETLVVSEVGGSEIANKDISGSSSGDVITLSNIDLSADTNYIFEIKSSTSRKRGFVNSTNGPFDSSDGNLTIVSGYFRGSPISDFYHSIVTVGNINL
jgi:hypothetical protein